MITNGYCTLAEVKALAMPEANADAADDAVIEDLVEAASRYIDNKTHRTFYSRTETRYFNVPDEQNNTRRLWMDDDLRTVTTLTNGDTTVLTVADYYLEPRNGAVKYAVVLKQSSTEYWQGTTDGDTEGAISIAGSWGYCATGSHPDDIKTACILIASQLYKRRFGENQTSTSLVTAAGVVITPEDVPGVAREIINSYRRVI
jgi:uncharacterized phiE125 gp8 family phage protein